MVKRLFLTGDVHQSVDIHKFSTSAFKVGNELTKKDIMVVMGDAGFVWSYGKNPIGEEKYWRDWINNKPWTTFCVCGNHENYDYLETDFDTVDFCGGKALKITDSLFYAITGEIYNLNGHRCLVINGADSHDLYNENGNLCRKPHISWWEQERITDFDVAAAIKNMEKFNNKVDFLLTHTGGTEVNRFLGFNPTPSDLQLDKIMNKLNYKNHFLGHYHKDVRVDDKTKILYNDIIEIY